MSERIAFIGFRDQIFTQTQFGITAGTIESTTNHERAGGIAEDANLARGAATRVARLVGASVATRPDRRRS